MERAPHLLIVDDDEDIRSLLKAFFERHAYAVSVACGGEEMFAALGRHPIDLVILDLMLQGEDGISLCRRLRGAASTAVIMLTAMSDQTERVIGLEVGADDYVTKPFDPRELLARVRAVLRRSAERPQQAQPSRPKLCFGKWRLDVARRELVADDDTLIFLTSGEFDLLLTFVEHPQRVLTRDQLLDARGLPYATYDAPNDRTIDVQVSRLRRKLEDDPKSPAIIRTVRNGGYMFALKVVAR
ncbi:response regulator [Rhizomicrobium palustre]|nr:response regulator [Rhizomicrobium palustre]